MTKREMFNKIWTMTDDVEIAEFCKHEIALLDKKSSSPSRPTAKQVENENLKPVIAEVLRASTCPMTNSEITKAVNAQGHDLSPNRIQAIVKAMKDSNAVVRTEVKKIAYFSLAE